MLKSQEDLHKIVPDRLFRYRSIVFRSLLNYRRQVASATILHQNVQDASIPVHVAVMISYNVIVMEVF